MSPQARNIKALCFSPSTTSPVCLNSYLQIEFLSLLVSILLEPEIYFSLRLSLSLCVCVCVCVRLLVFSHSIRSKDHRVRDLVSSPFSFRFPNNPAGIVKQTTRGKTHLTAVERKNSQTKKKGQVKRENSFIDRSIVQQS